MRKEIQIIFQDEPKNRHEKLKLKAHANELIDFVDQTTILKRERKRRIDKTIWSLTFSKALRSVTIKILDVEKLKSDSAMAKKDAEEAMRQHVIKGSKK